MVVVNMLAPKGSRRVGPMDFFRDRGAEESSGRGWSEEMLQSYLQGLAQRASRG